LNLYGLLPGMLDCATVEKIVGPFSSKKWKWKFHQSEDGWIMCAESSSIDDTVASIDDSCAVTYGFHVGGAKLYAWI
jgi:hypothetical protein